MQNKIKISKKKLEPRIFEHITDCASNDIYMISLEKVIEERCDELDYEIESENYEILHREYKRVATSIYNYNVYFCTVNKN